MLVIMAGLPGTGKSTLAHAIADRTGAYVLDKDHMRAALFPAKLIEYSREQNDFVVRVMLKVAGWVLRRNADAIVILDGRPFAKKYQLDQVVAFAEWIKTPWRIIECACSEETARRRIEMDKHPAADRDFAMYARTRDEWDPIDRPKLVVNTEAAIDEVTARAVEYITVGT